MKEVKMLILSPDDNVGILLEDAEKGDIAVFGDTKVKCLENIRFCHKIALKDISKHSFFIKYHEVIGYALCDVKKGDWVHIHNLDDVRGREGML